MNPQVFADLDAAWERVETATFSIEVPPGWPLQSVNAELSITTFDGQGHLSVIGVSSPELAPEQLARKLATLFRGEEPVTDATPIAQDGWSGFRQEFERRILWGLLGKCRCIGFVASNGPILVFGQARDTVRRLAEWAGVVDRMIASINIKHS